MTPDQIKALRAELGWSARQLAEALAVGPGGDRRIRHLESGERRPTPSELRFLDMLVRGDFPARYLPAPTRYGPKPKEKG